MQVFRDQQETFDATEVRENRSGELSAFCEIRVKGNHLKGPVPVEILYRYIFTYDESWQNENGFEVSQSSREFDSAAERNSYIESRFSVRGAWEEYSNRW